MWLRVGCRARAESEKQIGEGRQGKKKGPCGYCASSGVSDMAAKRIATQGTWCLNQNPRNSLQPSGATVVLAVFVLFATVERKSVG